MFTRTLTILAVIVVLGAAAVAPMIYALDAPADMTVTVPNGAEATKPPVAFSHTSHAALECSSCHHQWDGSSAIEGCSAEGCHTNLASKRGDDSFYMAFHERGAMQSCVGCHKATKDAGQPTGPTSCNECHA